MDETGNQLGGQRLIELLRHQQTLYRQLRVLTDRQKALVVREDTEALLSLLAERQRLVNGLVGLNGHLAPFRANWTELYSNLDEPLRREVAELLEEVNASLGGILKSDSRDSATLTARQHDRAVQMANVDAGSRASAAYSTARRGANNRRTDAEA